jgi:hypothetical protein
MWPPLSRHVTTFFESRDGFELIYVRFHPRVGPLLLSHNRNGTFSFSASFSSTVQDLYIDYAYFWRWYSLLHWHYIDLPFLAHTLVDKSIESYGSPCVSEDRSNTLAATHFWYRDILSLQVRIVGRMHGRRDVEGETSFSIDDGTGSIEARIE